MSITCQQIIDAARARNTFSDGVLGTPAGLIGAIDRFMRRLYAEVAAVDPTFFGVIAAPVAGIAGAWPRPVTAEVVSRIENAAGAEVNIVPWNDRECDMAPRVFLFGGSYRTVGKAGDPLATDSLTLFYAKKHPALDATQSPASVQLDATFPEQFVDLPVIRMARHLAALDNNWDGVRAMIEEEKEAMTAFLAHVTAQDAGLVSRFWTRRAEIDARAAAFAATE